jgi:tetratricopeptide (TPR) repeat protein
MSRKALLGAVGLYLLILLAYIPASANGFIWDDDDYVTHNAPLRTPEGLRRIWFEVGATPQYYPLVFSSFWVEYHLWGLSPRGYHWVNIALHAANALLLWAVLGQLAVPGAWFAAAAFGLHPVHVESVAWISERKNVLSGFLYLSAFLAYLRFALPSKAIGSPHSRRWPIYYLSLVLFLGALCSKTVTCSLPAVLLLVLWWKHGKVTGRDQLALAPFFAAGLCAGLLTAWVERHVVGAEGDTWDLSPLERVLIAGRALWFYAGTLAWPTQLAFMYPRWEVNAWVLWQYLFPLAAVGLLVSLWLARGRLGRGPLTACLCFAGTLLPALGFFNVFPFRYSFVADHFQYLASAALLALAAAAAATLLRKVPQPHRWLAPTLAGSVLCGLAARSWAQEKVYHDLETLWSATLRQNPDCWMAHNNLGNVYLEQGKLDLAVQHFRASLRIKPDHFEALGSLGETLTRMGQMPQAEEHFRAFVAANPRRAAPRCSLGIALARQGKRDEAEQQFRDALNLEPGNALAHYNLGIALGSKGQTQEATQHFRAAVQADPLLAEAHYNFAVALLQDGRRAEALNHFQQAVEQRPGTARFRFAYARLLQMEGRPEEARRQCQQAISLDPMWLGEAEDAAWHFATDPDPVARNGPLAVELARAVVTEAGSHRPRALAVAAAAYAEVGLFEQAAILARNAQEAARLAGDSDLVQEVDRQLSLYRQGKPFRSGPSSTDTR